jgi:hypothetical protein
MTQPDGPGRANQSRRNKACSSHITALVAAASRPGGTEIRTSSSAAARTSSGVACARPSHEYSVVFMPLHAGSARPTQLCSKQKGVAAEEDAFFHEESGNKTSDFFTSFVLSH